MIFVIDWHFFQMRYLVKNTIFVKEESDRWECYTFDDNAKVKCVVAKTNAEADIMLVTRFFADRPNVIKVEDVEMHKGFVESDEDYSDQVEESNT